MKVINDMKKIISAITAVAAVAALSVSASAYTIDTDLGFGWSASTTIPGEEFADVTTDSTVTITYTTNPDVMDSYWCIKLMINDEGWPFVDNLVGPELSEDKSSYNLDVESSSIEFKIPAAELEHIQIAGMAIMGHGITLKEMTFSNDAPTTPAESEKPSESESSKPESSEPEKKPVDTGVEGIAGVAGIAAVALGAVVVSRKRK